MLNILISLLVFFFFLALGCLLMFLDPVCYYLIIPCFIYLIVLQTIYKQGNCVAIEPKDFFVCLIAVIIFLLYYQQMIVEVKLSDFSYLYLITFITTMMFVNTIRFKSLI